MTVWAGLLRADATAPPAGRCLVLTALGFALAAAIIVSPAGGAPALSPVKAAGEPYKIELGPITNGRRSGRLALLFRNETGKRGTLRIRYLRDNGARELALTEQPPQDAFLELVRPAARPLPIRPREIVQLVFEAKLPATERLSALDGTLIISVRPKKPPPPKPTDPPDPPDPPAAGTDPAIVGVTGALRSLDAISAEPATVVVQITRHLPWSDDAHASAEVRLIGANARTLMAEEPKYTAALLLRNEDGHDVHVTLSNLRLEDGIVAGTLKTNDAPPLGSTQALCRFPRPRPSRRLLSPCARATGSSGPLSPS